MGFMQIERDFNKVDEISAEWTGFQQGKWDLSTVERAFTRITNSKSIFNPLLYIGWEMERS